MNQTENSLSGTLKAGMLHEQSAAGMAAASSAMEQLAFFEVPPADAVAITRDAMDETTACAAHDNTAPEQSVLFPESLVQRLIAARDARGWSREQVAAKLHLPLRILQWIEAEQYDRIGQGVYLRGYLTNYARLVGVPADAVEDLLRTKAPSPPELIATGRISRSRYLVERYSGAALYLVLTGVFFVPIVMLAMNMGGNVRSHLTPLDATTPAATSVKNDTAAPATAQTAAAVTRAGAMESSTVPLVTPAAPDHDSPLMASFTIAPTLPATDSAQATIVETGGGRLRLSLSEASWVEIVDVDGKRLEYSTLPAGTVKEYPADKSLTILLGNIGGAKVEVDGQAQDIAPYSRGNVARFKLAAGGKSIAATVPDSHNG
jgi:cytoskeleton protein RodZ